MGLHNNVQLLESDSGARLRLRNCFHLRGSYRAAVPARGLQNITPPWHQEPSRTSSRTAGFARKDSTRRMSKILD
jgi:hypothetical protein